MIQIRQKRSTSVKGVHGLTDQWIEGNAMKRGSGAVSVRPHVTVPNSYTNACSLHIGCMVILSIPRRSPLHIHILCGMS
jgi:hypothetical protein